MLKKYPQKTDSEYALLVQNGEEKAFEILLGRYEKKLFFYLSKLSNNREDSLDILQETFLKTYQNIKDYDPNKKFSSWIYRIAHNTAINFIKKKHRSINFPMGDISKIIEKKQEIKTSNELDTKISKENKVKNCLSKLKEKYKQVLILQYLEDKSYEDISYIMKKPLATIKTWLRRAKKSLEIICKENEKKQERKH